MIKFAYCYFDKKLGAFTSPGIALDVLDPEQTKIQTERAIKFVTDVKTLDKFDGLQLFQVGEFDDVTGQFTSKLDLLIDMDSLCYPIRRYFINGSKDGDSNES